MTVNYYYSIRVLETVGYTEDDDSMLSMCRACAAQHAEDVKWASRGDDQSECEFCGASNDPAHSAELDTLYAQVRNAS